MKVSNCTEDWNKMDPNEIGKFCSSCNTSVYDIHDKSLIEIHELKSENRDNICGRISKVQLAQFRFLHPMKRFAIALFLVFGTGLFNSSIAQLEGEHLAMQVTSYNASINFYAKNSIGEPLSKVDISFNVGEKFYLGKTDSTGKMVLDFYLDDQISQIDINIFYDNTFAFVHKAIHSGENRLENIIYNPETGELKIGEQTFQEEFLLGEIMIDEDWEH